MLFFHGLFCVSLCFTCCASLAERSSWFCPGRLMASWPLMILRGIDPPHSNHLPPGLILCHQAYSDMPMNDAPSLAPGQPSIGHFIQECREEQETRLGPSCCLRYVVESTNVSRRLAVVVNHCASYGMASSFKPNHVGSSIQVAQSRQVTLEAQTPIDEPFLPCTCIHLHRLVNILVAFWRTSELAWYWMGIESLDGLPPIIIQ